MKEKGECGSKYRHLNYGAAHETPSIATIDLELRHAALTLETQTTCCYKFHANRAS